MKRKEVLEKSSAILMSCDRSYGNTIEQICSQHICPDEVFREHFVHKKQFLFEVFEWHLKEMDRFFENLKHLELPKLQLFVLVVEELESAIRTIWKSVLCDEIWGEQPFLETYFTFRNGTLRNTVKYVTNSMFQHPIEFPLNELYLIDCAESRYIFKHEGFCDGTDKDFQTFLVEMCMNHIRYFKKTNYKVLSAPGPKTLIENTPFQTAPVHKNHKIW